MFGNSVVNGVRSGLQQTYVETLKSFILPAYEKANAELFKQLYDTFNKGTIACKYHKFFKSKFSIFFLTFSFHIHFFRHKSIVIVHKSVRANSQ